MRDDAPGAGSSPFLRSVSSDASSETYREYLLQLQEMSLVLHQRLDPREVLKALIQQATQWLDIPRAEIYLVDEQQGLLVSQFHLIDGEYHELRGHTQARGVGLAGLAWETGEPQIVLDYFRWAHCVESYQGDHIDPHTQQVARVSVLSVPLKIREQVVGVLDMVSKDPDRTLGQDELTLLQRLISLAAVALENAWLYEEASRANAAKSTFLANMSHELRTPLNAIIGYAEFVEEELHDEGLGHFARDIEKIKSAGQHILSMINGLLDLSKIEAGKMECFWETVSLPEFLARLAEELRPLIGKRQNQLRLWIGGGVKSIETDRQKLRQILLNLLSNAAKFTEQGEILLAAELQTRPSGPWIQFRVEDQGIGMDQEQLSQLFEKYTQLGQSSSHRAGGTGLGMAIVKELCEIIGGEVTAASTPGQGSQFAVYLPVQCPENT